MRAPRAANQLLRGDDVFRCASQIGNKDIRVDGLLDELHSAVAHTKECAAFVEAVNLFVVLAIEQTRSTLRVDYVPVLVLSPASATLGAITSGCGIPVGGACTAAFWAKLVIRHRRCARFEPHERLG